MKRYSLYIITVLLILAFSGCSNNRDTVKQPANFYYCTSSISFDTPQGVIASEIRETAYLQHDFKALRNNYLCGPNSSDLISPFPSGSTVVWLTQSDSEITLVMNQQFTQLSGLKLSLACSCLSKTIFSFTDLESITIRSLNTEPDEHMEITMTRDSILIQDRVTAQSPAE